LLAIGSEDEKVSPFEPAIELRETVAPGLDFNHELSAEKLHSDVAGKPAAGRAAERDARGIEAGRLQQLDEMPLGTVAFLTRPAAAALNIGLIARGEPCMIWATIRMPYCLSP
jgi:hypothetical protein